MWKNPNLLAPQCTACGADLSAATGIGKAKTPEPGSLSICFYCGSVAVFDEMLALREPTEAELAEIAADPQLSRIISRAKAACAEAHASRPRR